jgi:hypothetical protein
MQYDWDNIDEDMNLNMPVGKQTIQFYHAYQAKNVNGKPFLHFKAGLPEDVSMMETDDNGNRKVSPHGTIQFYYETDFGVKSLKHCLKRCFGEENLKHLDNNEKIIKAINEKMPKVVALIQHDVVGDRKYSNFLPFEFDHTEETTSQDEPKPEENDLPF